MYTHSILDAIHWVRRIQGEPCRHRTRAIVNNRAQFRLASDNSRTSRSYYILLYRARKTWEIVYKLISFFLYKRAHCLFAVYRYIYLSRSNLAIAIYECIYKYVHKCLSAVEKWRRNRTGRAVRACVGLFLWCLNIWTRVSLNSRNFFRNFIICLPYISWLIILLII